MNYKKILIIITSFIIFSSWINNIYYENDLQKLKLRGNIKRIQKRAYQIGINYGELEKIEPISKITIEPFFEDFFRDLHFNKNGNIIKSIMLDSKNRKIGERNIIYDNNNRIIKEIYNSVSTRRITYYDSDKKSIEINPDGEKIISFYENNNIIKQEYYRKNKLVQRIFIDYNDGNKKITEKKFTSIKDGLLTSHFIYKYDKTYNLVTKIDSIKKTNLNLAKITDYKYNEFGDVVEINYPNEEFNGILRQNYSYKYDTQNNWIERIEYDGSGTHKTPVILTERIIEYY